MAQESGYVLWSFSESHLIPDVKDEEIKVENKTVFREDRINRSHGGVVVYIRDDVVSSVDVLGSHSHGNSELLMVKIKKREQIVTIVYRPPESER